MALSNISVKPLTASIGAEVEGVDLAQPLSDDTFNALHDAFDMATKPVKKKTKSKSKKK